MVFQAKRRDEPIFCTTFATGEVTIPLDREIGSLSVADATGILFEYLRLG
jgi:hypothetical protein